MADAAGARLIRPASGDRGPDRVVIDSREAGPGTLFVGLAGSTADGGSFAAQALAAGAWGVLTRPQYTDVSEGDPPGAILAADDPLAALQRLASAWRRHLAAKVIGVTGSTGKTTTKDLLLATLAPHRRTVASRQNFNTEIGLPLEILGAPEDTEVLVLEMAMRGAGQIAALATVAEPEVGVIVSIGPVHLELLGTIEAIAATKAELISALPAGGTAVLPAREPLLEPHLRKDVELITFGDGGDVRLAAQDGQRITIDYRGEPIALEVPFTQAHLRTNLLAAVAAAKAIGVTPSGRIELALLAGRGQRTTLRTGVTVIDDCYNANPMSMRAALEDLAATANGTAGGRRVAILGDMLELGPDERRFHVEIGEYAGAKGVELLIAVGPLAGAMGDGFPGEIHTVADADEAAAIAPELLQAGDVVLIKASRGVGLERVFRALGPEATG